MSNMRQAITTAIRQQVYDMYTAGCKGDEILAATHIGSRKTLYKIIRELGIEKNRREDPDALKVIVTIPAELSKAIEGQDLSALFADFLKTKFPYSEIEGGSVKVENQKKSPYSQNEGNSEEQKQEPAHQKEKSNLPYSKTEGTQQPNEYLVRFIDEYGDNIARRTLLSIPDESIIEKQVRYICKTDNILKSATTATVKGEGIDMEIAI